ncbi:MAG TPA: purine-nucleoside phosphorylase [bacterium]|nr:purine-nucleoside phosphorylase [bacterium]
MTSGPGGTAIEEAADVIRRQSHLAPECGIVLGSGLGTLADAVVPDAVVPYRAIPHFPVPTAAGHAGDLVLGRLDGRPIAALRGRAHLYEGHTAERIVFPIRVLAALGAPTVILTNAAGGLDPGFHGGDLMLLTDHINWTGTNPLVGPNDDRLGPRFPDMSAVYDPALRAAADAAGEAEQIPLRHGVYVGVLGPSYETPAEIRMLRAMGADAVGMSTVLEAIAARHAGLRVLGIAAITNAAGAADATGSAPTPSRAGVEPLTHDAVLAASEAVAPRFARLVRRIVRDLPASRAGGPASGGGGSGPQ